MSQTANPVRRSHGGRRPCVRKVESGPTGKPEPRGHGPRRRPTTQTTLPRTPPSTPLSCTSAGTRTPRRLYGAGARSFATTPHQSCPEHLSDGLATPMHGGSRHGLPSPDRGTTTAVTDPSRTFFAKRRRARSMPAIGIATVAHRLVARARARWIALAARTRVHRRDEQHLRGEGHPREHDSLARSFFERLAQAVDHGCDELGELVEKEHAMRRESYADVP